MQHLRRLKDFARILLRHDRTFRFTVLEIGAAPADDHVEPFYHLLDAFPGSRIIGFEVDAEQCAAMNRKAAKGVSYLPVALGRAEEVRPFYVTKSPLCCSLYRPNEDLLRLYNQFDMADLVSVTDIETQSLDHVAATHGITDVDFIKIDVQGASLDVFQGGEAVLKDVAALVSEVEFLPHYVDQPLFGEVCSHLAARGLMFHRFLGLQGRALKPMILNNNPFYGTQHIWADAVFVRDVQTLDTAPPQKLAKLAILAHLYGSFDLTFHCMKIYDQRMGTTLHAEFRKAL